MIRDTFSCEMRPWLATSYEWTDPTTWSSPSVRA